MIWKWIAPAFKLAHRLTVLETHSKADYGVQQDMQKAQRLMLKGLTRLIDNAVNGNSFEKVSSVRDEIQTYLFDKE